MATRKSLRLLLLFVAASLLGMLASFAGFRHFRAEVLGEAAGDRPFHTAVVQVTSAPEGPPLLTLDAKAIPAGVIVTRRLEATRFQAEVPAVGSAVDPVDLAWTRDTLVEATEAAGKADADLQLARGKLAPQPGSDEPATGDNPANQTARQAGRLEGADVRATVDTARLRRAVALALYGPGLTGWMTSGNPELTAILQYRSSLLLLTPLPGRPVALPTEAMAVGRRGEVVPAHLVSVAYRIDPRFQNVAALYQTDDRPADPHFIPGPAFSASLPVGPVLTGIVAPAAAVLLTGGKSWVYVEESPSRFRRQEISLAFPLPAGSGWFQEHALHPGQIVVSAGAALLLGEEK